MLTIKVLGPGCENCKKRETAAREAKSRTWACKLRSSKSPNGEDLEKYPILATPGLVINEKLVCAGRVPNEAEVTTWLVNAEMENQ